MSFRSRNFITRIDLNKTPRRRRRRRRHELMFFIIFVLYSLVHTKNDEKILCNFFSFRAEHTTLRPCGRIVYIITPTAEAIPNYIFARTATKLIISRRVVVGTVRFAPAVCTARDYENGRSKILRLYGQKSCVGFENNRSERNNYVVVIQ